MAPTKNPRIVRVPVTDDTTLFVEADLLDRADLSASDLDDHEVAGVKADLHTIFAGLKAFAVQVGDASRDFSADKVTIQFGCEVGLESGGLVAVIGKAGAKSSMNVTLEWARREG